MTRGFLCDVISLYVDAFASFQTIYKDETSTDLIILIKLCLLMVVRSSVYILFSYFPKVVFPKKILQKILDAGLFAVFKDNQQK